jgi:hypothetical protein
MVRWLPEPRLIVTPSAVWIDWMRPPAENLAVVPLENVRVVGRPRWVPPVELGWPAPFEPGWAPGTGRLLVAEPDLTLGDLPVGC